MLPGFRFLFTAIVLSMALLIFGLGAAALLRAAHEEVASIPSRRPPPETIFAQRSDSGPALAMLRVEPSAADEKPDNPTTSDNVRIAAPAPEQAAIAAPDPEKPAAEPDGSAAPTDVASRAENPSPSDPRNPQASPPEIPAQAEMPAPTDVPSSAAETRVAAIAEITPIPPDATPVTTPDQAATPIDDSTRIAETRIATLGGPPVTIETQAPSKIAPVVAKKSAQARRVVKRRRIAPARVTQQAPQTPADPFARPFGR
jgi:hypothetical protein